MNVKTVGGLPSTKHSAYKCWSMMRDRCLNPNSDKWKWYGARGISVAKEWDSFEQFLKDVGDRPSKKHSLERVDNNKNYCQGNVVWADHKTQCNNRRTNSRVEINGVVKTQAQWSEEWEKECGIPAIILMKRVFIYKWELERAKTTKYQPRTNNRNERE